MLTFSSKLGVESQSHTTFYARFRYRPTVVNWAPPTLYFLPTAVVKHQMREVDMPGVTAPMAADSTERYRTSILSAHREALSPRSVVGWDVLGASPREFGFPYVMRPL